MSAPDLTASKMRQFAESGADKHLTLLLGAGASTSSGLPNWNELATRLLLRTKSVATESAAALLLAQQDPMLVVEGVRKTPGANWNRRVAAALYDGITDPTPSALHVAAAAHFLAGDGDTTLVTLNFDVLLESAIHDGSEVPVESRVDDQRVSGKFAVHHLHGIVAQGDVRNVVLTLSDFNELLGDAESWQLALLRRAVLNGALVIAGTSYRDPDLRRWLHVALADQPDEHAALVILARQGFELSRDEFRQVESALIQQWSAVGLLPVIVEDHTDAAQVIRELRHVHRFGYIAPQERALAVWEAHSKGFHTLQVQYSDQLAADAEVLKSALGVDHLNVTLWLADGRGHIARWASQDRIYRDVENLRLVDSGHDSRWIAGRALGSEEPLFLDLDDGENRRWTTVLAMPVRVKFGGFPEFATAVISVGMHAKGTDFASNDADWLHVSLEIANAWSALLIRGLSVEQTPILD